MNHQRFTVTIRDLDTFSLAKLLHAAHDEALLNLHVEEQQGFGRDRDAAKGVIRRVLSTMTRPIDERSVVGYGYVYHVDADVLHEAFNDMRLAGEILGEGEGFVLKPAPVVTEAVPA